MSEKATKGSSRKTAEEVFSGVFGPEDEDDEDDHPSFSSDTEDEKDVGFMEDKTKEVEGAGKEDVATEGEENVEKTATTEKTAIETKTATEPEQTSTAHEESLTSGGPQTTSSSTPSVLPRPVSQPEVSQPEVSQPEVSQPDVSQPAHESGATNIKEKCPELDDIRNKMEFGPSAVGKSLFNYRFRTNDVEVVNGYLCQKIQALPILTPFMKDKIATYKMKFIHGDVSFFIILF